MTVLGWIFLVLLAIIVVGIVVTLLGSLPDLRRYFAIRRM